MDDRTGAHPPVAFLFTDIEGSTRHWEQFPAAMAVALMRHDAILRDVVRRHGGQIYRSAGDAVQAYFPDCLSAVQAAIDAQRTLLDVDWGVSGGMRVRMAVHATEAEQTGSGDYRSPQLRRLEAILAAGHGGQILLSDVAAGCMVNPLPAGIALMDLGSWQLPDTGRSAAIFQIVHDGLPSGFPALNAFPAPVSTIAGHAERFFGRQSGLRELQGLLDQPGVRLITLIGPGGIGKTRLAQQLALELRAHRGANVWFVELTGLTKAEQVLPAIASALQLSELGQASMIDTVVDALSHADAVLVLDNFEHLLAATASISDVLMRAPRVRIVVTSRMPLKLRGERQYPVEPLDTPPLDFGSWEELWANEAVQLFVDRAISAVPAFALGEHNAVAVAGICRKLEGLPLAIELAAPRVRVLSVEELNERLDDRLGPLSTPEALLPDRHRAMRASIDWSYELLTGEQQWFFRQLGVLQSGFVLDTLEGLFGGAVEVLELTEALVDQNLVQRGGFRRDPDRLSMLESVRQYALEQLERQDELAAMQERHARYYASLVLAKHADQRSFDAEAIEQFKPELGDLRQSILWLAEHDLDRATEMAAGAWRIWFVAGQIRDADLWLDVVLNAISDRQSVDRVRAMYGRAIMRSVTVDLIGAERTAEASRLLATELGDDRGIGDACNFMAGIIFAERQDRAEAERLMDTALAAYARIGDQHGRAETLLNRSSVALSTGAFSDSLADGLEVVAYCREHGKDVLASNTIQGVAEAARCLGDIQLAIELLIEALELNRRLQYDAYTAPNIWCVSSIALALGRYEDALRLATFSGEFALDGNMGGEFLDPFGRAEEERARLRSELNAAAIDRATAAGKEMTVAEAVEDGLALLAEARESLDF